MTKIKDILGEIPYTAELYWLLRQKDSPTTVGMNLTRLAKELPGWVSAAQASPYRSQLGKKVLVFGMIHYWIEHTTLLALALAGIGHEVTLATLPYSHWRKDENRFDLRRQNSYILKTLQPASSLIDVISLFKTSPQRSTGALPKPLEDNLRERAYRDTQYSLLSEEIEIGSEIYNLRLARNRAAVQSALKHMEVLQPDAVITPNGSILEFGVIYQIAKYLDIPVATFEFGEQNYRMWLAQDDDVMRQDTSKLWNAYRNTPLDESESTRIRQMFEARQGARVWQTFERQWQTAESQGGVEIRKKLDLDHRPLAFLPTNVLGDSLTLGRQTFLGMTEWIRRTIRWFEDHQEYQLVVRVHPGEQIGWGPSTYELLQISFPNFPKNVRVLPANFKINSYDLVEAARVGLVYTTTMGLEMAMIGKPVIVTGTTHYRAKGFTLDPENWEDFVEFLFGALQTPDNFLPSAEGVKQAWTYAYRFFFQYPQPFPWHIQHFWDCLQDWPLERVLSVEGVAKFGRTFRYMTNDEELFGTQRAELET